MGRVVVFLVVVIAVAAGLMYWKGNITGDGQGGVQVTAPSVPEVSAPQAGPFAEGDQHFAASRYRNAINAYQEALKKSPDAPGAGEAMYRVGKSYDELGQAQEAVDAYRAFVQKHPGETQAQLANKRIAYYVGAGQAK